MTYNLIVTVLTAFPNLKDPPFPLKFQAPVILKGWRNNTKNDQKWAI